MNKSLLTLAVLSTLAVGTAVAAPAGSTEQADRKFLENLENSQGAPVVPAEPVAPAEPTVRKATAVEERTPAKVAASDEKASEKAKTQNRPSAAGTSNDPPEKQPAPTPKKARVYAQSPSREKALPSPIPAPAPAPTVGLAGHQRAPLTQDVIVGRDSETTRPAPRTAPEYRSSIRERPLPPVDNVPATSSRTKAYVQSSVREKASSQTMAPAPATTVGLAGHQRTPLTQEVIVGRETTASLPRTITESPSPRTTTEYYSSIRKRALPPEEVAPAAPVAAAPTKTTTVIVVPSERPDHERDYDSRDEHGFFHRLFHHKHSED